MVQSSPEARTYAVTDATPTHHKTAQEARKTLQDHSLELRGQPKSSTRVEVASAGNDAIPKHQGQENAATPKLDAGKRPDELAKSGAIKDHTKEGPAPNREKLAAGETPEIKVQFSDSKGPKQNNRPDFIVNKDGSIHMMNDPEKNAHKQIVVELQRDQGQIKPTEAQQKSVDELYKYLDARLKTASPDAAANGVKLDDSQGLVSKQLEQQLKARDAAPETKGMPDSVRKQIEDMERFRGSHGGHMSRKESDNYFPERTVPLQDRENQKIAAMKDVVAGFVSRGDSKPYEHVVHRGDRGWGVGRYGLTYDMMSDWLSNVDMKSLDKELQKEIQSGQLSQQDAQEILQNMQRMKDSVAKYKQSGNDNDLDPFLKKLKTGDKNDPVTKEEINKYFGKQVQELAASYESGKFSKELAARNNGKVDPGELALSMMLGHVPDAQELSDPGNKRFIEAARQAYNISINRRENQGDIIPFSDTSNMTEAMKNAVGRALWTDYAGATQHGNLGCAITVSRILKAGGVNIGDQLAVSGVESQMRRMGAQRVSLQQAISSGQVYVVSTGRHVGMGQGDWCVENSSAQARAISHSIRNSSLRNGWAYIVPGQNKGNTQYA